MSTVSIDTNEKNKWESQSIAKHFKNQKNLSAKWRHNKYRKRLKTVIKRKSRHQLNLDRDRTDHPLKLYHQFDDYHRKQRRYDNRKKTKAIFTNIVCNNEYKFSHPINELLALKPDIYLGSKVVIAYWYQRNIQFEGELTCISHLGFIRLQNVIYRGDQCSGYAQFQLPEIQKMENAYWFHYKCISNIALYNDNEHIYNIDITAHIMDLLKLKVIQWLETQIFGFSYKMSLIKKYTMNYAIKDVINCGLMKRICNKFWKEQKRINCFALFLRRYKSQQREMLRFNKEELGNIIYEYMKVYDDTDLFFVPLHTTQHYYYHNYLKWDSYEIARLSKRKNDRTV